MAMRYKAHGSKEFTRAAYGATGPLMTADKDAIDIWNGGHSMILPPVEVY